MKSRYSLDDLRCFCVVARHGSFKAAATSLGMPLSTLSRRIRQLEDDLQLRLLNRDAHRVTLTSTGEQYFQRSAILFDELHDIDQELHRDKYYPQGKIRISAPINAGSKYLRKIFYDFLIQYPEIQLELNFSGANIDVEAEGIDMAFRVGTLSDEDWIAKPIKDIHFIFCSHPDYDVSTLSNPEELHDHPLIICRPIRVWEMINHESGEKYDYSPKENVRLEVDEGFMMLEAIKTGIGIGYVPSYLAYPMIANGEIKRVLPAWSSEARTMFMLYRDREHIPMRVRLLIDFVMKHFQDN
ncbi:putative transcriptional regulator (LysR family protein) [Photobacterium sp. SKA34]|uniref:LysR family transcriptional regulator n=1 Tax=Photobacterium sp. SKA34 TaxID=121723 RepID=UPI00006B40B5|nr:LysR family transcriptional regulator [Photobacterium sp. SKA34]EAR57486.1 putative transcriptional regulator (LysR family protein) [Photobacterium sp. SKA34]